MASQTIVEAGVRADLAQAHQAVIDDLGQPGDWLNSAEKLAVAQVVRAARDNSETPPWYQPSKERDDLGELAPAAADAAWRLTNHPGTLTANWYADIVAGLPSAEFYVELVGTVARVNSIDRLADLLDLNYLPLPPMSAGPAMQPTIESSVTSHWVPTAVDMAGPNVLKALSVAPSAQSLRGRLSEVQYLPPSALRGDLSFARDGLNRMQIELVAGVTSLHNECFY